MEIFLQDVRYALRGMRRAPGFTAAAILTLALGMGATTAIFSVIRAVLLSPLPYGQPEKVAMIWSRWKDFDKTWVSDGEVADYRRLCPSLASVAAWESDEANLTGAGEPLRIGIAGVTANVFETLGVRPRLGRGFTPEEDRRGGPPVVVLGDGIWQSHFGGDPGVLGRVIELDGVARRVVGVMPRGFALPTDYTADAAEPSQAWIPLRLDPASRDHGNHGYYAAARLARGATVRKASAELATVTANSTREGLYPVEMRFEAFAVPVDAEVRGGARRALLLVFGAVLFLLLMACVNVANLLLARAEGRQREISVRAAIGAGSVRLTRQLLTESLVLAVGGAVLGLAFAWAGVRAIAAHGSAGLPATAPIGIQPGMLLFSVALAVLTTVLFGFAPALRTLRWNLSDSLREGSAQSSAGLARQGLRGTLAAAQMALALVLLLGAGLMLRSLDALMHIDLGFEPRARSDAAAAASRGGLRKPGGGHRLLSDAPRARARAARRAPRRDPPLVAPRVVDRRLGPGRRGLPGIDGPRGQRRLAGHLRRSGRSAGRAAGGRAHVHGLRPGRRAARGARQRDAGADVLARPRSHRRVASGWAPTIRTGPG